MAMPSFLRFLQVIRKGSRSARVQAWGGLVLLVGAGLWLIFEYLLPLLGAVLVAFVGFVLVRRSLREEPKVRQPLQEELECEDQSRSSS